MASTYVKTVPAGRFTFSPDTFMTSDFVEMSNTDITEDTYRTVAEMDLRRGEGAAIGRGDTEIPEYAEGFIFADVRSANDGDGDGNKDAIVGRGKIVVLNANNTVVDTIWSGRLDELRTGEQDKNRRDRKPLQYQTPGEKAAGEVYGEEYSIGLQVKPDSGTDKFSLAASSWKIEGYYGAKQN